MTSDEEKLNTSITELVNHEIQVDKPKRINLSLDNMLLASKALSICQNERDLFLSTYPEPVQNYVTRVVKSGNVDSELKRLNKQITAKIFQEDSNKSDKAKQIPGSKGKVFLAYNYENDAMIAIQKVIREIGYAPINLSPEQHSGTGFNEIIETMTDVNFAIVLYSECDSESNLADIKDNKSYQSRQNLVFEHGYLIARLGNKNVCSLIMGSNNAPTEIPGVQYIWMSDDGKWKNHLLSMMKAAGLKIDANVQI